MKKVMVVMFLALSVSNVWASQSCIMQAKMAEVVMQSRQSGVPITTSLRSAKIMDAPEEIKEFFKLLIHAAYKEPMYNSEEMKQQATTEFSNKIYLICEEG